MSFAGWKFCSQSRLGVCACSSGDELHQPKAVGLQGVLTAAGRSARSSTDDPVWRSAERRAAVPAAAPAVRPGLAAAAGALASACRPRHPAHEQAQERLLERPVEDGVDDRVEDAGGIAEPEEPLQANGRDNDDDDGGVGGGGVDDDDGGCGDGGGGDGGGGGGSSYLDQRSLAERDRALFEMNQTSNREHRQTRQEPIVD